MLNEFTVRLLQKSRQYRAETRCRVRSKDVECVSGSANGVDEATDLITMCVCGQPKQTPCVRTDGPATPI